MKFIKILLFSLIIIISNSCKKQKPLPINLLHNALIYQSVSEEAAASDKRLFRGEPVVIVQESGKHYLIKSPRLNILGWIAKKYILKEKFSLGTIISQGRLSYAEGTVLIPTDISPEINSRVIILGEHKNWYLVNYRGAKTFYIEKNHVRMNHKSVLSSIHVEGFGAVEINTASQDLSIIGYENRHNSAKMLDNDVNTFFLSSAFEGKQTIEISFPIQTQFELKLINGNGQNLAGYRRYGRIYKLDVITENGTKQINLKDNEIDFQTIGLFDARVIKLQIRDIYPGTEHPGFAISEIVIKPVDTQEYAVYRELLARRSSIYKTLFKANTFIRKNEYHKAIEYLEKAQEELPEQLKVSYLGIGIKVIALRIYLEKLKDMQAVERMLDSLLSIAETENDKLLFDLSRNSRSGNLGVDMQGVNVYFNEKQFRNKSNYHFPTIYLKSHIYYLAAKASIAMNKPAEALDYFKKILLHTRKFTGFRSTLNETFYSKLTLDLIHQELPPQLAYSFLKNKILPEYETGRDEREDENYFYYILAQLSEKAADRTEAVDFYKRCLNIPESNTTGERPFSFTLALKRLREMGER